MLLAVDAAAIADPKALKALIADKRDQMSEAVKVLDFETAALIRDEIYKLEEKFPEEKKSKKPRWPKKGIVVDLES